MIFANFYSNAQILDKVDPRVLRFVSITISVENTEAKVIGVLFTLRSGAETRRRLAEEYRQLGQSVHEGYEVEKNQLSNELKTALIKKRQW